MKYEIDIEGLPEGYKPVAYRSPKNGEYYFYTSEIYCSDSDGNSAEYLIVEKIQPRRIVLEETTELMDIDYLYQNFIKNNDTDTAKISVQSKYVWREVKENKEEL